MKNVLVVAPHADDEILGCGGTIYKHVQNGDNVFVAIMTDASIGAPEIFNSQDVEKTRKEALLAHKVLGVKDTVFFNFPAPQLEQHPQYKIASAINSLIENKKIDTLYIPHKGDLHLDHGVIYNASLVAARPTPGQSVLDILSYETLSETEWGHPTAEAFFIPRKFIKLTESQLTKKLEAMECFSSQLKSFPNSRSLQAIKHLAALRGSTVSTYYAEAFDIIRSIDK